MAVIKRLDANRTGGHQFDGLGIFASGGAGTLQANLTRDNLLQRERDLR